MIEDLSKVDFISSLVKKTGNPYLSSIGIELTLKCNLNCKFCYLGKRKKNIELPKGRLFKLANEITALGFVTCLFMGGEPFIRKDFPEIYRYFYDKGLFIIIHTNGTILDNEIIRLFKKRPPFNLVISLYGASDEAYHRICGKKVFKKLRENLITLKEAGVNFKIVVLITKEMLKEWMGVKNLIEELKVWSFFATARIISFGNRKCMHSTYRVTKKDLKKFPDLPLEFKKAIINAEKYLNKPKECSGYFYITADERLQLCHALPRPSFKLNGKGLKEFVEKLKYGEVKLKCPWR